MNPQELYRAGRLTDAIKALSAELRDNPTDIRRRTFLFELLCFAGEYDRADKQLEVLGQAGPSSELGVLLYRSALYAERQRHDLFERGELPLEKEDELGRGGMANGNAFSSFSPTGASDDIYHLAASLLKNQHSDRTNSPYNDDVTMMPPPAVPKRSERRQSTSKSGVDGGDSVDLKVQMAMRDEAERLEMEERYSWMLQAGETNRSDA